MNKKYILIILLFFLTACAFPNQKKISQIKNRSFRLNSFTYILTAQDKKDAMKFFSEFPVKKIMFMLAREYNIKIDISDFQKFLVVKNKSDIKLFYGFRAEKSRWPVNIDSSGNNIDISFEKDYIGEADSKFRINISSGGSVLHSIATEVSQVEYIFKQLEYFLKSGKESAIEYDLKNYNKVKPVPLIVEFSGSKAFTIKKNEGKNKILKMIEDHMGNLSKEEREQFKHDIIDYMYKHKD